MYYFYRVILITWFIFIMTLPAVYFYEVTEMSDRVSLFTEMVCGAGVVLRRRGG